MVSSNVRPQLDIVSTRLPWNASKFVSERNSALARIPCNGDRSSCEMLPMKSPFCLLSYTEPSRETYSANDKPLRSVESHQLNIPLP